MRLSVASALTDALRRQQQVIATHQIIAAGVDHEVATREVAAGRWQRPARGVFYAFSGEPTLVQRAWSAQLVGGATARVSGPLACHLLGVADSPSRAAVVLVTADCQRRGTDDFVVRRTSRLPEPLDWDGLRVAPATRAILDATRLAADLRGVRALVCAGINGKHTTYDDLVDERSAEPRPGLGRLRHALRDWAAGSRSAPEAEVADALREQVRRGAMPPFLLNPKVYLDDVLLGALDVYVPGCSFGGETDSVRHHGSANDLDATLKRHGLITRAGIELEHVTPARFRRNPLAWAAMFAMTAQSRRGMGDPSDLRIVPVGPLQDGRRRSG